MHETTHPELESSRSTTQRGFSLAEVLVASALMSVILLALFGLVTAGMHRAYGGKKMTEAAVLAESVMERVNRPVAQSLMPATGASPTLIRTQVWTLIAPLTVTPAAEASDPISDQRNEWRALLESSDMPQNTTLTVTVEAMPTGGPTFADCPLIRITVDVAWTERGTRNRSVRLQSLNVRAA